MAGERRRCGGDGWLGACQAFYLQTRKSAIIIKASNLAQVKDEENLAWSAGPLHSDSRMWIMAVCSFHIFLWNAYIGERKIHVFRY